MTTPLLSLLVFVALAQVLSLAAAAVVLWRARFLAKLLWRVFVTKGPGPMDEGQYAAYRLVQHVAACLAEEGTVSRVLLVETAPRVQRVLVDVSGRGQLTFLLEHMRRHGEPAEPEQVVVDLGANEGLLGSHSYNLVQLGWWAALVEANPALEPALRWNTQRDRWMGNEHRVVIRAVAATEDEDGPRPFQIRGWRHTSSSLVADRSDPLAYVVTAAAESVRTLTAGLDRDLRERGLATGLPRHFGLLSVDIEGSDFEVIRGFISAGYRPRYLVVEERTDLARYDRLLGPHGYSRIAHFDADAIYWRAAGTAET